jgi:hypothetical protein
MNAVQAAGVDAIRNPARVHTRGFHLSGRDHTVLSPGDCGNAPIHLRLGAFPRHIRVKAPTQPISPSSSPVFVQQVLPVFGPER